MKKSYYRLLNNQIVLDYEDEKKLVEEEGPNGAKADAQAAAKASELAAKTAAKAPVDDKSSKTKTVEESKNK